MPAPDRAPPKGWPGRRCPLETWTLFCRGSSRAKAGARAADPKSRAMLIGRRSCGFLLLYCAPHYQCEGNLSLVETSMLAEKVQTRFPAEIGTHQRLSRWRPANRVKSSSCIPSTSFLFERVYWSNAYRKKACTTAAPQQSAPSLPVSTCRSNCAGPRYSVSPDNQRNRENSRSHRFVCWRHCSQYQ